MARPLTGEQVAALAGISCSGVSRLKTAEDPLHRQAGGYDCAAVGRWLLRRALASVGKSAGEGLDLSHEQALLARARRLALEDEARVRAGEFVEWVAVKRDVTRAAHGHRDAMLSIPGRIASQLVGLEDERVIDRLLTEIIRSELTRLASTSDPLLGRGNGEAVPATE